jgi:hypothetical protein
MRIKQSEWRLINAPAVIGDNFNGAVIVPMFPMFFLSLIIKVMWLNYIPLFFILMEFYRMKKKLPTIMDAFKYIFFKYVSLHYWHGFRRAAYRSLTSIAGAMLVLSVPFETQAGFNIIKPAEAPIVVTVADRQQEQGNALGAEFIDNKSLVKGAGPAIELEHLLKQIMPGVYSIEFKSVEIAAVKINWKSTHWTLDQVLGNIAIRYGIMFETMQGSSVVSVHWYDKNKCEDNKNRLFKRLCGSTEGFYID